MVLNVLWLLLDVEDVGRIQMSKYGKIRIIIGIVVTILGLNQLTLNHFNPTTEETIVAIIWIAAGIVFIVNLPEKLKRKLRRD